MQMDKATAVRTTIVLRSAYGDHLMGYFWTNFKSWVVTSFSEIVGMDKTNSGHDRKVVR
jgi:hypothetical protein